MTEIMKGTDIFSSVKSKTPDETMDMTFDEFGNNLLNMASYGRDLKPVSRNKSGDWGQEKS